MCRDLRLLPRLGQGSIGKLLILLRFTTQTHSTMMKFFKFTTALIFRNLYKFYFKIIINNVESDNIKTQNTGIGDSTIVNQFQIPCGIIII